MYTFIEQWDTTRFFECTTQVRERVVLLWWGLSRRGGMQRDVMERIIHYAIMTTASDGTPSLASVQRDREYLRRDMMRESAWVEVRHAMLGSPHSYVRLGPRRSSTLSRGEVHRVYEAFPDVQELGMRVTLRTTEGERPNRLLRHGDVLVALSQIHLPFCPREPSGRVVLRCHRPPWEV